MLFLRNCKWRRQRQPRQHWGNVYYICDRVQLSDCEPAGRAEPDQGENSSPEYPDWEWDCCSLAQDNLFITLLMSQYPTDYDHLYLKSLRWLMWHKAASFSCISMWWKLFLCKICALVCSKTGLSSRLLIFDTITYGFSCAKTCVYFDNLTSDLCAIWLLQVEDERLIKMSFCSKVSF